MYLAEDNLTEIDPFFEIMQGVLEKPLIETDAGRCQVDFFDGTVGSVPTGLIIVETDVFQQFLNDFPGLLGLVLLDKRQTHIVLNVKIV